MDKSSLEEGRKLIASNLEIAESNKLIASSNETLSLSTTQASLNIANAIALIDIAALVAVASEISDTLKDLVKVLTPAEPNEEPIEPIKEIDGN